MTATLPSPQLLADPDIFLAIEDLDLAGCGLADAVWHGQHRSLLRGEGVEFHSHQHYQSGDDLRRVNWSLFARSRRLYTRQSRQESRRPVHLLLDASASMGIQHSDWSKLGYAQRVLAGAAHLARRQGDAPSLGVLSGRGLSTALPPRSSADHVTGICAALAGVKAADAGDMGAAFQEARTLCRQRGFILLISDFLDSEDALLSELAACRTQGHDVFALQVLDTAEVALPKSGDYDFLDPENGARLRTSVEEIADAYAQRITSWRSDLRRRAESNGIRWSSVHTGEPLVQTVRRWLDFSG
jgi:uncharacterized protein (DUF58 family)